MPVVSGERCGLLSSAADIRLSLNTGGPHPSGRVGDRYRRRSNAHQKLMTSTSTLVVVCVAPLGRVVVVLSTFTPQPSP